MARKKKVVEFDVWIVGTHDKEKAFRDINEAYEYRGRLSKINGHHKSIPIKTETWSEEKWRSQVASSSEGKN